MRKSNASLVHEALDIAVSELLDTVWQTMREHSIPQGLSFKLAVMERVAKKIAEMDPTTNGNGKEG